jgi:hypothetical protein
MWSSARDERRIDAEAKRHRPFANRVWQPLPKQTRCGIEACEKAAEARLERN